MSIKAVAAEVTQALARGLQPRPDAFRANQTQHLAAQAQTQTQATGNSRQQEIDQNLGANFPYDFGQVPGRQHPHPTGKRGDINEEQGLIAQDHQSFGDRFG
ncbi:hypothetical protein FHK92_19550 [Pseudomonas brassicacearum subsp. neoaurantiaca]|uniref:Uncharacterized protein n=1 Tax=Pseudomonas brassicacearum subsp. neoaurantiaca TaxID=494916 RepID=A0A7V8UE98_9PSED|nr:hypothetical protein [Pseudomonas brassicacearum subsp. neoaurantiaca]